PNAMYTKKYKVVLSNETKQANCPVFRTNDEYWVYGYVLDGYTDFQDWKDQSIESISGIYDSWENDYWFWATGNGSYFWPSGNEGIKVIIPPEGYITLDLNQDDITAFNSLKYGQTGTIRYTHTETIYDAGNAGVFSEEKLKHYYRYKFDNQDEWSSWIEASKISNSNNYSLSIQKNDGNTLVIQFARGNISEEFAQTYYDTGFYLSDITEKTINLVSQDTPGELKTLESPEYTIEIWKSRLSDEAKYQFVEYLDNSFAYATNKNVVNFDFDFNEMINMRFEAEISFSSDTHEQALFGSDYKTKFGYAVFVKRNSATSKSIGIYDSTCSTYSDIVYHSFDAEDDERIKIAVGTEGIFVNDEKISSQAPVITTSIPGSGDIGLSLFNMSEIHNFVNDWSWTSGKKLNTSGTLDNNSSYSTTDYLPLTVYDNYSISGSNVNNDIVCYYTENKTLNSYSNPSYGDITISTWNSPIKYFRYSHVNSDLSSIKITNMQSNEYTRSTRFPAYPYVLGKAFTGKIYSFKVFDEEKGEYSFDFSPCYNKESSEQGFYDNLHKVFYRAYTGSQFKSGPNVAAKTYGMLVDISNICVSSLNLSKERNLPDTLSVDIEYVQFKKKLASENTSISDVIKPYLVDVVVKRNFETIFTGTLMYAKVTLQAVGKQTLTLQAMGYGEQFAKRYINCSYGDMNYPQMAKQIVYDAQHEMNWIDNYDFLADQTDSGDENDTSYFNGWGALDSEYESYIPVKAPDTNSYLAHWQNGSIPIEYGCMLQCFKMSCSPLRGGTRWGTTGNYNQYLIIEYYLCNPASIDTIQYDDYDVRLTFTFETDGEDNTTNTYSVTLKDSVALSNSEQGVNWTKCSHLVNLGKLQGSVKHIMISNNYQYASNTGPIYIN
ncbi:MAG TPA: hypothetical protein DCS12_11505, partial [Clostridiales bacterium]|nr:hypothetical protein [Clostridiales bacterium]